MPRYIYNLNKINTKIKMINTQNNTVGAACIKISPFLPIYKSIKVNEHNNTINKTYKTISKLLKVLIRRLLKIIIMSILRIAKNLPAISGAVSLGLTVFFILANLAANERGYYGAVGGEIFPVLVIAYFTAKLLRFLGLDT